MHIEVTFLPSPEIKVRLSPKQATPPSGNRASISKDRNPRLHLSKIRVLPDRRIPIAAKDLRRPEGARRRAEADRIEGNPPAAVPPDIPPA
ncbi:MAG: hypothetical protein CW342_03125 [Thermoactinomycetaceae bacterium]|nr:hypothetical protein [Thermoactinomycetaceae bacterium]